jgi:flagellar biosynthesis protein FlhB
MAQDSGEKTEEPTAKKIEDARKEGNVPRSQDVSAVLVLFIAILALLMLFPFMGKQLINLFHYYFSFFGTPLTMDNLVNFAIITAKEFLLILIPFALAIMIGGIIGSVAQFGFLFTTKPLNFKFNKLNPISGLKNLFSIQKLLDGLKSTFKSFITLGVGFYFFFDYMKELPAVETYSLHGQLEWVMTKAIAIAFIILFILAIFAAIDLFIVRKQYTKKLKMTKQEVKDEMKNSEGDPKIKAKIRQIQMKAARQRMMSNVAQADVVVTNPTHYAVAIEYNEEKNHVPIVVAKGMDNVAIAIKSEARKHNVHIVENPPLARSLYAQVEVEEPIPEALFGAVAEVLAYVYKMNKK